MKVFLDDIRKPPNDSWVVVRTYDEFVAWMQMHDTPEAISFDHDLGFEHYPYGEQDLIASIPYNHYKEKTGYHAARWCVDHNKIPAIAIVHSWNIVGARNIANLLSAHTRVFIHPYQSQ